MSETLFEIRQSLYHRQRFITPIVKNLDTGEIYSHSELSKVPIGVDPSILSQSQKRADLGELLCAPVVPYIPTSWHPNFITSINHVCNWILFTLAFSINLFPDNPNIRVIILILCAWMNFVCMMLDCLDGMHARRTKQCSKLGEFLDHWLDAMHVPLVCGGITHSLHMATTLAVGVIFLNNMVYNAQLIVYHYKRVFMQTSGVEGQVLTSGFYLIAAAAEAYDPTHTQGTLMIANMIGVIGCIVSVKLTYDFVARHDAIMLEKCALFFILNAGFSFLYLFSYLSEIGYILTMAIISFRVTGCFVLFSILQQPYKGYDLNLYIWLLVFGWTHLLMRPILVRQMYENALPYIPPGWDLLGHFTVQSLLPYIMFIHIGIHQAQILIKYYYKLR